jgi:hypothetical protein
LSLEADCGTPDDDPDCDAALKLDDAPPVVTACPWNACEASSESSPAAVTAPATSQRLIRRISPKPASRAVTARCRGAAPIGRDACFGTEVRFIADDCSLAVEATAKECVSRL